MPLDSTRLMQWIADAQQHLPASSAPANAATCGTISAAVDGLARDDAGDQVGHHQRRQVVEADVAERGPEQGDSVAAAGAGAARAA